MRVAHRAARGIADWAKVSRYTRRAMGPRIVVRDLTKAFAGPGRDMHALSGISLAIDDGEFVCVVGPSGCGTTLLRILAGLETETSGDVEVRGVNAMVFQEASLFPWLSVADNVAFGLEMRGLPRPGMALELEPNACLGTHRVNIGAGVVVTTTGAEELNDVPTRVRHVTALP